MADVFIVNTTNEKLLGGNDMTENHVRSNKQQNQRPESQQNPKAPGYGDKKLNGPNRPAE